MGESTPNRTWLHRTLWAGAVASIAVASCGEEEKVDEDPYPPFQLVEFPEELQSRDTAIAMRITNAFPGEVEVNRSLVNIAQTLDIVDFLTRGGVPDGAIGAGGGSSDPGGHAELLAGTSVEQVRAYYERVAIDGDSPFSEEEAVDSCGNPVVASFIHPSQLQHAAPGAPGNEPVWPEDCSAANCDTLQVGTLDVYVSSTRPDGMLDMVINLLPDMTTNPPSPGLFGHLLAYFPSRNNPGFTEAPVVVNARQVTVSLENLWQRQKAYVDLQGARELYAFPSTERTVFEEEVVVLAVGNKPEWCEEIWAQDYTGLDPYGCSQTSGIALDRNPDAGSLVYSAFMKDGTDDANLDQLVKAFENALRSYAVCPSVAGGGYIQDGPVEMFICPPEAGSVDVCVAQVDMEQGVCKPEVGGYDIVVPENASTPVELSPQTYPYLLVGSDDDPTDTGPSSPPFSGNQVRVEVVVEADTVLFLSDGAAVQDLTDRDGQPVELPESSLPCEEGPTERFDVGEAWGPGVYTLVIPWGPTADDFVVGLTSVDEWIF